MKAGKWEKGKFIGSEICGKMLGIIGIGNIGRLVADRAQGLKMKVIAYDPFLTEEKAQQLGVELVALGRPPAARRLHLDPHAAAARDAPPDRRRGAREDEADARASSTARAAASSTRARSPRRCGISAWPAPPLDVFEQEPPPPDHPLLAARHRDLHAAPRRRHGRGAGRGRRSRSPSRSSNSWCSTSFTAP